MPVDTSQLRVSLRAGGSVIADDVYAVIGGEVHRRIALSDPGIDDYRNELLWSPESPTLILAEIELRADGEIVDRVSSYTALRSIAAQRDRVVLNNRPYLLRLVLDQGYWPDTGLTAPDDAALRTEVELAKRMGFNGVRKHQKLEDHRYLYWSDVLGLLVWDGNAEWLPVTKESVEGSRANGPRRSSATTASCVMAWVPESWSGGVPNLLTIRPNAIKFRLFITGSTRWIRRDR